MCSASHLLYMEHMRSMSDRRRSQRYVLGTPLTGDIMPMHDVVIERFAGTRAIVLSPSPHSVDERLMIHVSTTSGLESHRARVVSSTATSSGGALQYRIELDIVGDAGERGW